MTFQSITLHQHSVILYCNHHSIMTTATIVFANSLGPDRFDTLIVLLKYSFEKKKRIEKKATDDNKSMNNFSATRKSTVSFNLHSVSFVTFCCQFKHFYLQLPFCFDELSGWQIEPSIGSVRCSFSREKVPI